MKYLLALVAVSYALRCLAWAIMPAPGVVKHIRAQADKIEHEAQQPGLDELRRVVELVWFVLYVLIVYRLVTS